MKAITRNAIGTFQTMATKEINGFRFTSWRTPDNKRFFLAPASLNLNIERYGVNPDQYEISYVLLGQFNMVR